MSDDYGPLTPDEQIALQNEFDSLKVMYEMGLPRETVDAIIGAPGVKAKIDLGERLKAGQPQALAVAASAASGAAQSQPVQPPRDELGRFSTPPAGFGGGTAPSGQVFSGRGPHGEHPADSAIRTAAGF